ncbi:MAG: helix-turn-helix domain-containing protein [Planctomycetota bacterium]|jgi:transposase InsO family protein
MTEEEKTRIALWRLGVLGPLVSARLERGDRANLFSEAAARTYEDHAGRRIRIAASTVEAWYYRWRKGGFEALKPKGRCDVGYSRSISPEIAELILDIKRENPRRSIRRIIRMLERAGKVRIGELSKSSVHRLLQAHGLSKRPARHYETERRAFRHPHAGDLWMGDVMHGPRVIAEDGRVRKSYLHLFLDSATRFVPGAAFQLSETAADHESVLKQAFLKHGLPRVLYLDRGAAQISGSLKIICAELGVRLVHARPYDPQAKGAIEKFFSILRSEVESELPDKPLELEELNSILWSWVSAEYHRRVHGATKKAPLGHWLEEIEQLRLAPRPQVLDEIFLHRSRRKVRQDSTVRFGGKLLEVRPELCGLEVELRYDPHSPNKLPQVFVNGEFYCDTVELDLERNSSRRRHRPKQVRPEPVSTGIDPLKQIQDEYFHRARPPKSLPRKEK